MHKKKSGKIAIVVLSGALKKTKNGWRTTNFNDKGDLFGVCGDRLRILAASAIYKVLNNCNKEICVIASGGRGQYFNIAKDSPLLSKIIKKELAEAGIPSDLIIRENNSNNTCEQLRESAKILKKRNIRDVLVVSNRYHLPRIKAFIRANAEFDKVYGRDPKIVSAEDVLIVLDPKKWRSFIAKIYRSKEMRKRVALERKGTRQIENETYDLEKKYKLLN